MGDQTESVCLKLPVFYLGFCRLQFRGHGRKLLRGFPTVRYPVVSFARPRSGPRAYYTEPMRRAGRFEIGLQTGLVVAFTALVSAGPQAAPSPEQRAVAYLSQEVPNWPRQNHCFSCHNNGDAARALYVARSLSHDIAPEAVEETTAWLKTPGDWDDPKGDPGFSDLKLARIQFAAALTEAFQIGAITDRKPLIEAGERLLEDQEDDGSWDVDVPGVVGSPATYGDALGTYMARRTLVAANDLRFAAPIAKADIWFLKESPTATVDVCAVVLALANRMASGAQPSAADGSSSAVRAENRQVQTKHRELFERLITTQNSDGGWGPYPKSPSEPFDTAIAMLALNASAGLTASYTERIEESIRQGRRHLVETQLPAGGWPETTRPSGFQSYAQHISTSGWATLALLRTSNPGE